MLAIDLLKGKYRNSVRKLTSILICILCVANLAACGKSSDVESVQDEEDTIEIGFTFDSLVIERWERDRDVFVSRAKELGAEVNVQNANGDTAEQISQIEYFTNKKVDAIVIVATDCDALGDAVAKAKKAGIKVISYDRLISNADTDLYVSFDNFKVGQLMGDAVIDQIGRHGKILQINGPLTDTNVPEVMAGFQKEIGVTNIKVMEVDHCEGWKAEYAFDYVSDYLNKCKPNDVPVAVVCGNDSLAGQAIKALSERKLAGTVIVTGQDADLDACQRIVEGTQYMTVYKPVEKLAQRAAELTVELIKKGELDIEATMNDGTYEVPYESLEPIEVTTENMDSVIIGTFHQRSEVYLNVDPR